MPTRARGTDTATGYLLQGLRGVAVVTVIVLLFSGLCYLAALVVAWAL